MLGFDCVVATKVGTAVALGGLLAVETLPLDLGTKLAVDLPLMAVIGWLLWKTIPQMLADHKEAVITLANKTEASIGKLADRVEENGDRMISLLERTLPDSCEKD